MKNNRYTFMVSILVLFGSLTLFLSLFLISNFYLRGQEQSYKMLEDKNLEVTSNISNTILESLRSIIGQLNVLSKITNGKNIIEDEKIIEKVMWEQLKFNPNIASIFLADENGNFLQTRREPQYAYRSINNVDKRGLDCWYYKNQDYLTSSINISKSTYDPRKRDWYKLVENSKVFWSEPYIFDSTKEPGITISVGDFNEYNLKIKVAAVDFTLNKISKLLEEKATTLKGNLILFNQSKDVIATSFNVNLKTKDNKLLNLDDLNSSLYLDTFKEIEKNIFTGELKEKNGKEYIYFVSKLEKSSGQNWYIASYVEKDIVMADIRNTLLNSILISFLIIVIIYFPIQYILQRFVTKPINQLENLTNEIAQNKYENVKPIKTIIYEFHKLSSSIVSMAKSIQKYEKEQINLIDSFIKILAEAIDEKSPYTGGHCKRVPELAILLAKVASESDYGELSDFTFKSEEEWREFKVAAWLHDCGKIVMPEYVVDKATKLETIYNRIHEIRTRFEVLHRDATIKYYEQLLLNPQNKDELEKELKQTHEQLYSDFAFIASCNVGGEFMEQSSIDKLTQIGKTTWLRNFDNRLGLSDDELKRVENKEPFVPVVENLLQDKIEQIIHRTRQIDLDEYTKFGFKMDIPEYERNLGELYNLSIKKGTLTQEERFKINEHIIMTIKMLENIPFTKDLKNVPEYAGSHHETMIGTGYPRKLVKEELSIPARIMAIADIFEALTAADRPYKKAKTLSESIKIMSFMKKDKHIDEDLFDIFLTSGVYKEYANKFLMEEQIDEVDISQYLGKKV
ncbi:MAG: HD domain-containing protein [Aliarcobacter sp.]|nr:HD domain-containing protein [Aliarcobacter sp.]